MKRILTLIIVIVFVANSAGQGFALRPIAHKIAINRNDNTYTKLNKLVEMFTSLSSQDKNQLAFETSLLADLFRGIKECFAKEQPDSAAEIAMEAIKNNIPGITSEDVKKGIRECFANELPVSASKTTMEAIKNNIPGITSEDVKKGISECFANKRPNSAAEIAIEAIKNNIPGITSEDVKKGISECFNKGWLHSAAKLAIEAIKNNIPGITSDDIKAWTRECFVNKRPNSAAKLAIEAIKNNIPGITSEDIKAWISECFADKSPDSAAEIAIEAIKNNIPGITSEDVKKGISECFANKLPNPAAKLAIEAIKNNIPGITSEDVKKGIRGCYVTNERPDVAAKLAIEAIKNNIPGITSEDIKAWIRESFIKKHPNSLPAKLAIEAIKNNIPGITSEDIKAWISECFTDKSLDSAAELTIEAIKNKIPGITSDDIKAWTRECFNKGWSDSATEIILEAIKNNTPGITSDDIKAWTRECFDKDWPASAAKLAIEAIKEAGLPKKKITRIFNILKASGLHSKDTQILALQAISYAIENDFLDDLIIVLTALKVDKQILRLIDNLILEEGEALIFREIFAQKGLRSFAELHKSIYLHIFANLLPDNVNISNQRVNAALNSITHFKTSKFARRDLTIAKIYQQYHADYKAGRIKPLPEGLPSIRTIEVSTRKLQSLTGDAKQYYTRMMDSVKDALSAIDTAERNSIAAYQDISIKLLKAVEGRIDSLNQAKAKNRLSEAAVDYTDKQIQVLKEAAAIISESIKEQTVCLISFRQEHIRAISGIKGASPILQFFLFILAFQENSVWKNHFKRPENQQPSEVNIRQFVDFVDSFIKPHLLDAMEQKARVELLKHASSKIFKEEMSRLSQTKRTFKRRIRIYGTRGWIAEFIGYYSDECWTQTTSIMRDNPDTIALVFVDDETGDLLGGTLLMPNSVDGRGVLIDRGLSPRTAVTTELNVEDFVTKVADYEEEIARSLGKEMILVPLRKLEAGLGTNNPDIIEYYKRILPASHAVNLDRNNSFNNHDITTGRCVILREFALEKSRLFNQVPVKVKPAFELERAILSSA
jgi:uncharacterized protein (DUF433 family)